jgi:S1-C subfamily serine protease
MRCAIHLVVTRLLASCVVTIGLLISPVGMAEEPGDAGARRPKTNAQVDSKKSGGGILGMFLDSDDRRRVVVVELSPDSPADQGGVEANDILLSFDGQKVTSRGELLDFAAKALPTKESGEEVRVVVSRAGRSRSLTIIVPERADPIPVEEQPDAAAQLDEANLVFCMLLRATDGGRIVVDKVLPHSPPDDAGILAGDSIVSVGQMQIESIEQFSQLIRGYAEGSTISIGLVREEEPLVIDVLALPCRHDGVPADAASADALAQLQAKVRALQAQIEELRLMAEGISVMIEAMRQP